MAEKNWIAVTLTVENASDLTTPAETRCSSPDS
jgi:hypothetical protein